MSLSRTLLTTLVSPTPDHLHNSVTVKGPKLEHEVNTFYNDTPLRPTSHVPRRDDKKVDEHPEINKCCVLFQIFTVNLVPLVFFI